MKETIDSERVTCDKMAQLVSRSVFNHRILVIPDGNYFISELGSDMPVIEFSVKKGKIYRD